jgi:hypothetical protein
VAAGQGQHGRGRSDSGEGRSGAGQYVARVGPRSRGGDEMVAGPEDQAEGGAHWQLLRGGRGNLCSGEHVVRPRQQKSA